MKNNFVFFVGVFGALAISWGGIVIGSNAQLGKLAPYYDDTAGVFYPEWMPGVAAQGQIVYKELGCVACHTQQVRRPDFGSDKARGWGDRQSVARDYIYQPFPQLGLSRTGPDLTNLADRKPSAPDTDDLLHLLYAGSEGMPSYRFLFQERRLGAGAQASDKALKLTGDLKPKEGWEIVPTARGEALVGYLTTLKTDYTYPEAIPVPAAKTAEGEEKAQAAAPKPVPAADAAAQITPTPAAMPSRKPVSASSAPLEGPPPSPTPTSVPISPGGAK